MRHPSRSRRLPKNSRYRIQRSLERIGTLNAIQAVADAYYVLSDPDRRKEYDTLYASNRHSADPSSSSNFFTQFSSMFGGGNAGAGFTQENTSNQPDADGVFADVFEEVCSFVICAYSSLITSFQATTSRSGKTCTMVGLSWCSLRSWTRFYHRKLSRPRAWHCRWP